MNLEKRFSLRAKFILLNRYQNFEPPFNRQSIILYKIDFVAFFFLSCSVTIWVILGLFLLVSAILGVMACKRWPLYWCLANPLRDCLAIFWEQFKRFFWFLVRMFKTMLFYASLLVTTIVYTFVCCFCFVVIQEWPWVMAYRDVSKKFSRAEIQGCCRGEEGYQNIN